MENVMLSPVNVMLKPVNLISTPVNLMSTPVNVITREKLTVLIANNILNNSLQFDSDTECNTMETDSPKSKPKRRPVGKKLFHSPAAAEDKPNVVPFNRNSTERIMKAKKRKQTLTLGNGERIEEAYIKECDEDSYSPEVKGGMRKKILVSLFRDKEYCMDFD